MLLLLFMCEARTQYRWDALTKRHWMTQLQLRTCHLLRAQSCKLPHQPCSCMACRQMCGAAVWQLCRLLPGITYVASGVVMSIWSSVCAGVKPCRTPRTTMAAWNCHQPRSTCRNSAELRAMTCWKTGMIIATGRKPRSAMAESLAPVRKPCCKSTEVARVTSSHAISSRCMCADGVFIVPALTLASHSCDCFQSRRRCASE